MSSEVSTAGQDRGRTVVELERELADARDQQTATNEILSVISSSRTDVQPVFDAIVRCASRLCGGEYAIVTRYDGELLHLVAQHNPRPGTAEETARWFPHRAARPRPSILARALFDNAVIHVPDIETEELAPWSREAYRRIALRALVAVPMVHEGSPVGVVAVSRGTPGPFSHRQIDLLRTFADQAVIAIENTRLFEEVQARTQELQQALDHQTATSELLRVISISPTDIQQVFDTVAESIVKLCGGLYSGVYRYDGHLIHLVAHNTLWKGEALEVFHHTFPRPPSRETQVTTAILDCTVAEVRDLENDPAVSELARSLARSLGYRSILAVPMLHEGKPIGAITVARAAAGAFSFNEVDLLKTFGNQAVIAIENVRLFGEVQARNSDLTALGEVGRAVSSTLDLKVVLKTIVDHAVKLSGTEGGSIFYYRAEVGRFELGETTGLDEAVVARVRKLDIATGETGLGEAIAKRQPLQVQDILKRASNPLRDAALEAGLRAALIVPLLSADAALGALVLQRRQPGEFSPSVVTLMQSFADQSAIALENARLFEEIARKSRELEIASQHKSQFVANMSHELRTPLAAILGYAELMQEGFYEPQGKKSLDALTRIRSNGKHLLGLINTVLDIAKIESGQFSLNFGEYAIESVVETVRAATESLAETKKLALKTDVAMKLPVGLGDEQRLTQVLLNLVGNAIKFTDTGEVRITATAMDGHFTVAVTDTGPGIAQEHQARVFEQFHQVDNSNMKAKGGTGLGLAIAKQIVEMHGGRIWVESTMGQGSTFRMELPVRAAAAAVTA